MSNKTNNPSLFFFFSNITLDIPPIRSFRMVYSLKHKPIVKKRTAKVVRHQADRYHKLGRVLFNFFKIFYSISMILFELLKKSLGEYFLNERKQVMININISIIGTEFILQSKGKTIRKIK